jgi:2-polyprenyl-3-methyl-5-hydroxy-6-metoxy-1,4-benzoquinol methylase
MNKFEAESAAYQQTRLAYWDSINSKEVQPASNYYRERILAAYRQLIPEGSYVLELGCGRGDLLAGLNPASGVGVDFSSVGLKTARQNHPNIEFIQSDVTDLNLDGRKFDFIVVSELVNDLWDVQTMMERLHQFCLPRTRIIFNFYSHLWNLPLTAAQKIGMATPRLNQNWLAPQDMRNLLEISGFQPLRSWAEVILPVHIPLISNFANRYIGKLFPFRHFAMANFIVARPVPEQSNGPISVSVIVAARNESGHIDELIERIPEMGSGTEIIFVEGNSTDDTYEAIERAIAKNPQRNCRLLKQLGKGKGDAVRTGFDVATGDVLMILDADITVPPEDLPRFYDLIADDSAEFVNGVRLVYPMEGDAMRFLNLIGNKFFSFAFSWLLGQPIRDTLCGTKVLRRSDYERIAANRAYFGDFDPFGDFDLLFGAAKLNLKIQEVPIRYRARRYGETNISRWSHGWLLLKMVAFAARRIKFI